jgi:hypothetical protein
MSYMLAARCQKEQWMIKCGSMSSHRNYGKQMPLSFNKEIQSSYYQNTWVSIEGELLKWVNVAVAMHTCYFSQWSDNTKQHAAVTMHNMCCKL